MSTSAEMEISRRRMTEMLEEPQLIAVSLSGRIPQTNDSRNAVC